MLLSSDEFTGAAAGGCMQPLCSGVVSYIGSPPARSPVTVSVFYPLTQVGKRRGGVFLKTGMVAKKQKQDSDVSRVVDPICAP